MLGEVVVPADNELPVPQTRPPMASARAQMDGRLRPPLVESTGNTGTSRDSLVTLSRGTHDELDYPNARTRPHSSKFVRCAQPGTTYDKAQPEHTAAPDHVCEHEAGDEKAASHHAGVHISEPEARHKTIMDCPHANTAPPTIAADSLIDSNLSLAHSRKRARRVSNAYESSITAKTSYNRPPLKRYCTEPSTQSPSLAEQLRAAGHSFQMSPPASTPGQSFTSSSPATSTLTRQLLPSPFTETTGPVDEDVHIAYRVPVVPPQGDDLEADDVQIRHAPFPGPRPSLQRNHEAKLAAPSVLRRTNSMGTRHISARPGLSRSTGLLVPTSTATSAFACEPSTAVSSLPSSASSSTTACATSALTSATQAVQALRLRLRLALFKVETKQTDVPMQQCLHTQPKLPRPSLSMAATPTKDLPWVDGSAKSHIDGGPRDDLRDGKSRAKQEGHQDGRAKYTNGRWSGDDITSSAVKGSAADSLLLLGRARDKRGV